MGHALYTPLRELEAARIHFTLGRHREEAVLVTLTLVGERVEVDVFEDGHMGVSRFLGAEPVVGEEATACGSEDVVGDEGLVRELIARERSAD